MLLAIPTILDAATLARCTQLLQHADWTDGRVTAGSQAASVKNNRQLPEDSAIAQQLRGIVLEALAKNPSFFSAALPRRIYPPLFNHYGGETNAFGNHVDNAIRTHPASAQHVRTDLSFTLFLNDPGDYDGGELVIEDGMGGRAIKLPAGHLILYPAFLLFDKRWIEQDRNLSGMPAHQKCVRNFANLVDLVFTEKVFQCRLEKNWYRQPGLFEQAGCFPCCFKRRDHGCGQGG